MSEYTAEDFKNARFAEHDNGRTAMRPQDRRLWDLGSVRMRDYDMARDGWRPVREAPVALDTLREAWEQAEVPTEGSPIRAGDELLIRPLRMTDTARFEVVIAGSFWEGVWMEREVAGPRILKRAPQPEPWQALADLIEGIEDSDWTDRPDLLAKMLYERGVRATGGDET